MREGAASVKVGKVCIRRSERDGNAGSPIMLSLLYAPCAPLQAEVLLWLKIPHEAYSIKAYSIRWEIVSIKGFPAFQYLIRQAQLQLTLQVRPAGRAVIISKQYKHRCIVQNIFRAVAHIS
jgi:hypothetical protein